MPHPRRTSAIATIALLATLAGGALATSPAVAAPAAKPSSTTAPSSLRHAPLPRFAPPRASSFAAQASKLPDALARAVRTQLGVTPSDFLAQGAAGAQAAALVDAAKARGIQVRDARLDGTRLIVTVATTADVEALAGTGVDAVVGAAPAAPTITAPIHADAADPSLTTGLHGGQGWWSTEAADANMVALCSVGFNGTTATGPAFVTAGHCEQTAPLQPQLYSLASTAVDPSTARSAPTLIGTPEAASFQYGLGFDSGLIDTTPGIATPADVTTWGRGTGSSTSGQNVRLIGASDVVRGQQLCRSGFRSGWQCGYVLFGDHELEQVSTQSVNAILMSTCSQEGDSGGSVLSGQFAVGIVSGGTWPNDPSGAQPDPVCTKLASSNNKLAKKYLSHPSSGIPQGLYATMAFPMVSQDGDPSIQSQHPEWQLALWFGKPAVTSATTSAVSGTVALSSTPGAANPDAVQVTVDGTAVGSAPIAADGRWSLPLALADDAPGHRYTATAVSDRPGADRSHSTTAAGALLAVQHVTASAKISGTARVRGTLTATSRGWSAGTKPSYRWYANGAAISGATHRTLTLKAAQATKHITVKVTGKLAGWAPVIAASARTKAIAAGTMHLAVPAITGRPVVGATLREHPGIWSPLSVKRTVRWFANGRPIAGATRSTLRLTAALYGKRITVTVTAKHAGYVTTSASSRRRVVVD